MTWRRRVNRRREGRRPIVSPPAGLSHLKNGPRIVADELPFLASEKTLVKQDAHRRRAPPWNACSLAISPQRSSWRRGRAKAGHFVFLDRHAGLEFTKSPIYQVTN